jgi:hypothetical protein
MQVLSESGTLQRVAISLKNVHVITNPLLDKDRKECCGETEDEGHEPENVYANVRSGWLESREGGRRSRRDGNLWNDSGDLVGNLI